MALAFEQQAGMACTQNEKSVLPFEQQPKESDKAFAAFSLYLSLGPDRSLIAVAKTLNKDKRLMITWSKRYNWSARVQAYETHISQSGSAALNPLPALTVAAAKALDAAQQSAGGRAGCPQPAVPPSTNQNSQLPDQPLPVHQQSTINHQPFSNSQPPSPSVPSVISCKIPSPMPWDQQPQLAPNGATANSVTPCLDAPAVHPLLGERAGVRASLSTTISNTQHSTLNSQLLPWDQQPGETGKNFAAFTAYLALGPTRTLAQTAAATGRTKDQLAHWSHRWRWRARAAAYHAHLAAIERRATEQLVAEKSHDWAKMHEGIKRQAWAEAEDLIALAQDFKARWRDSDRLPGFDTIIRALELAFKLKQFAAGMPSEIKAVNTTVTGLDGGPIRVEVEAALQKIYGQPLPGEILDVEVAPAPDREPSLARSNPETQLLPSTINHEPSTTSNSQLLVAPKPSEGGSTLNSQQSAGGRAGCPQPAALPPTNSNSQLSTMNSQLLESTPVPEPPQALTDSLSNPTQVGRVSPRPPADPPATHGTHATDNAPLP